MKLTNNAKKIYETWFNSSCELESDSSDFLEDYLNFFGDIGDKINID